MPPVIIEERPNPLRQKLGGLKIASIFTPERIAQCQQIINNAHVEIRTDIYQRVLALRGEMQTTKAKPNEDFRKRLMSEAHAFKSAAESLGMALAFEISRTLVLYVCMEKKLSGKQLDIVEQLLALLVLAFHEGSKEQSNVVESEVLSSLSRLEQRIANAQ